MARINGPIQIPQNTRIATPTITPSGGDEPKSTNPLQSIAKSGSELPAVDPISAGIKVGSKILDVGMTLWGQHKQDEANKENKKLQAKWAEIQNNTSRRESARQWKWMEEDKSHARASEFINNMVGMMNADAGLKNNMVNLWRTKK